MATELLAGLGIFKSMLDMAKGLKDINDATVRNSAVIELQEKILAAQAQQTALIERIGELEKEMTRFETWDAEKERYELKDVGSPGPSVFAYALKIEAQGTEPLHLLCAKCFQHRDKSILQATGRLDARHRIHVCPECNSEFAFSYVPPPPPPKVERYDPLGRGRRRG